MQNRSPLRITENPLPAAAAKQRGNRTKVFTDRDQFEFVEIRNISTSSVALAGINLSEAAEFVFPAMTLSPGAYVLVVDDVDAFTERYGSDLPVAGAFHLWFPSATPASALFSAVPPASGSTILNMTTTGIPPAMAMVPHWSSATRWPLNSRGMDRASWRASSAADGFPGER